MRQRASIDSLGENRTRVTFFLPANPPHEQKVVHSVIHYLESQRTRSVSVDGFTWSSITHPVFHGVYWDHDATPPAWTPDRSVLFIVD